MQIRFFIICNSFIFNLFFQGQILSGEINSNDFLWTGMDYSFIIPLLVQQVKSLEVIQRALSSSRACCSWKSDVQWGDKFIQKKWTIIKILPLMCKIVKHHLIFFFLSFIFPGILLGRKT